jgi:uncharacterized membrane protein
MELNTIHMCINTTYLTSTILSILYFTNGEVRNFAGLDTVKMRVALAVQIHRSRVYYLAYLHVQECGVVSMYSVLETAAKATEHGRGVCL